MSHSSGQPTLVRSCTIHGRWQRRLQRWWGRHQWLIIGGLWFIALILGWVGHSRYTVGPEEVGIFPFTEPLYRSLQMFVLEFADPVGHKPWELEVARFLAPAVMGYTVFLALETIFYERLQSLRLRFLRNHVVICGLGRKGTMLARGFQDLGIPTVGIEADERILQGLSGEHNAMVLGGDATNPELLRQAGVDRARYVVAVTGDDGVNVEIATRVRELAAAREKGITTCFVHLSDASLRELLKGQEILSRSKGFNLEFFDVFEQGALAMLRSYPLLPAEMEQEPRAPHLLVIGAGRLGRGLILAAARQWWARVHGSPRLRVTVVDRNAREKGDLLLLQHSPLRTACDLTTITVDVHSPDFQRADFVFDSQGCCLPTAVYVCLDGDSEAMAAGLLLARRLAPYKVPVVVRTVHQRGLASLLPGEGDLKLLYAFGLLDRACGTDLLLGGTHEMLARAVYDDYGRRKAAAWESRDANSAMAPWEDLTEELRESNRRVVDDIARKLRGVGCGLIPLTTWDAGQFMFESQEVEMLAQMEHERWMAERLADGWQPGKKDGESKRSPHLVPWEQLSEDIKDIDREMMRNLPAFLARAGFELCRLPPSMSADKLAIPGPP